MYHSAVKPLLHVIAGRQSRRKPRRGAARDALSGCSGYSMRDMARKTGAQGAPRRSFLTTADCPHCHRGYFIEGTAPIDEGHRPHYFACECGHKVMGAVPTGAEVSSVHLVRSSGTTVKTG
jgi:hypothetical protein